MMTTDEFIERYNERVGWHEELLSEILHETGMDPRDLSDLMCDVLEDTPIQKGDYDLTDSDIRDIGFEFGAGPGRFYELRIRRADSVETNWFHMDMKGGREEYMENILEHLRSTMKWLIEFNGVKMETLGGKISLMTRVLTAVESRQGKGVRS